MVRPLKALAAVFVVSGLLVVTLGTGAFTSVTADRTVSGAVAADSQAYLGVEDVYQGGNVANYQCTNVFWDIYYCAENQQPRSLVDVENRYATDYDVVDVRIVSVEGNGSKAALEVRDVPASLAVGDSAAVSLGCSNTVNESATVDVVLGFEASGSNVTIDGGRMTVTNVTYYCADTSELPVVI